MHEDRQVRIISQLPVKKIHFLIEMNESYHLERKDVGRKVSSHAERCSETQFIVKHRLNLSVVPSPVRMF